MNDELRDVLCDMGAIYAHARLSGNWEPWQRFQTHLHASAIALGVLDRAPTTAEQAIIEQVEAQRQLH